MNKPAEIGVFAAKTHLSDLVKRAGAGESFVITQRGVPMAQLVPIGSTDRLKAQTAAAKLRQFMKKRTANKNINLKVLISEGRD
jgi:prevent-host-death family protein